VQRTYLALMGMALGAGLIQLAGPLLARTMPSRAPLNQARQQASKPQPMVSPAHGTAAGGLPTMPPPPPLVSSSGSGASLPGQVVALEVVPFRE